MLENKEMYETSLLKLSSFTLTHTHFVEYFGSINKTSINSETVNNIRVKHNVNLRVDNNCVNLFLCSRQKHDLKRLKKCFITDFNDIW